MSKRAITQLIKSHTILAKKISAMVEEKAAMLESVEEKYTANIAQLEKDRDGARTALQALGLTHEQIIDQTREYSLQHNLTTEE